MNIDAEKIRELISDASNVVIMAHKNLDLDALGSSLGVYYLAKLLGKNAYLLIEDKVHEFGVDHSLKQLKQRKINININTLNELEKVIDKKTLLFVLDVHIANLTQNKDVLKKINDIILIDHHVVDNNTISKLKYECIIEEQSSTTEIIIELLKDLDIYIPNYVATIMLAGIMIDTNDFFQKTTFNTYEAAAFLAKQGADNLELQYLLKEDLERYIIRQKIINKVEILKKYIAIGVGEENTIYYKEDLAKVSDELLLFNHIEAAFTIGKISKNMVGISARSLGKIDVQEIMEKLNGGGHETDAATQLTDISIEAARDKLLKIIYNK